jgi:hypothetical protein
MSDDGVRLWVNGQQLVNNWTDHGPTENSGTISLTAGTRYSVRLEYYERGGGATAQLSWSSSCQTKGIVPATQLYPASAPPSDPAQYGFESSAQSWVSGGAPIASVASSTDRAFAGAASLKMNFSGGAGAQEAFVANPSTPAGRTVTFRIWFPAGSPITSIQPYALQGASGGWAWTGTWRATSSLTAGQWNTITVAVPTNAVTPLAQLGVEFVTNASWTGSAYVDSVSW